MLGEAQKQAIGKALGRVPSGVFILTARDGQRDVGMLVSWVQQAAFEPPAISISLASGREILRVLQDRGHLAISILGQNDHAIMKRFARGMVDSFDGLNTARTNQGLLVLGDALAWLEGRVISTCEFGADHLLLVAQVLDGHILRQGEAFTHQRGNGFHY